MFTHLVITRFNVRKNEQSPCQSKEWLQQRTYFFEKYCYGSFLEQTNKNFKWLICFDKLTDFEYVRTMKGFKTCWEPVFMDFWSLDLLKLELKNYFIPGTKYLITTRIDNDDSVSYDFIELIQREFNYSQVTRLINFNKGFAYDSIYKKLYIRNSYNSPFISLIEEMDKNIKTVFYDQHQRLHFYFKLKKINTHPCWCSIIHQRNTANSIRKYYVPVNINRIYEYFPFLKKEIMGNVKGIKFPILNVVIYFFFLITRYILFKLNFFKWGKLIIYKGLFL